MNRFKPIFISVGLILAITLIGMSGYILIEKYRVLDAFYMTIITVATVGFQEVHPLSDAGRIFTAFLIMASFGTFAYSLSAISKYVVDGELNSYFKNLRVTREIEKLENHVIICGYGRNGKQAAYVLKKHNQRFVVIEQKQEIISNMSEKYKTLVLQGDG